MTTHTIEIPVLYGSQTGNSEAAAKELSTLLPTKLKLPPSESSSNITITSRHMHLDDFLEIEKAPWTKLVLIVTSSYGVGQAPIGSYRFRDFCDSLLGNETFRAPSSPSGSTSTKNLLTGVRYALLGLGDSKYSTYFRNPTVLDDALTQAGATRVGPLGKADASGTGEDVQALVIERWIDGIWTVLQEALLDIWNETRQDVATAREDQEDWFVPSQAREGTNKICQEIFDDWDGKDVSVTKSNGFGSSFSIFIALLVVLIAFYARNYV